MKSTVAAEHQFPEWDDGMLKLPPRPTRVMASGISLNGRSLPTACLMAFRTRGSPRQITTTTMTRQMRPRTPSLQSRRAARTIKRGTKNELPLKNGISRSKTGLLNVRLMNRNRATSTDWNRCIAASVVRNAALKTEITPGFPSVGCQHVADTRQGFLRIYRLGGKDFGARQQVA